jgi:hypothetical protein
MSKTKSERVAISLRGRLRRHGYSYETMVMPNGYRMTTVTTRGVTFTELGMMLEYQRSPCMSGDERWVLYAYENIDVKRAYAWITGGVGA